MDVDSTLSEQRQLYGFGQNEHGQLGLGSAGQQRTPALSESCCEKDVVYVAAGNEQTAVLTNTGEVYCCGCNTEGQCGVGGIVVDGETQPAVIESFTKVILQQPQFKSAGRIRQVHLANGCEHLLLVTEEGELQTCGRNTDGQLGHGDRWNGYSLPKPVGRLAGYRVSKVACSFNHTIAVTDNDQTWAFGANHYGQLGQGDTIERLDPTPVACLEGAGVMSVACGLSHTVFSTSGGDMYSCGKNNYGQLGLDGGASRHTPVRHQPSTAAIDQLACGYFHTVMLDGSGGMFAFGRNDYGQLGLGHRESTWQATQVPDLAGKRVVQVACGSYHTIALDVDGRVYPFGRNNHGQLGTGTTEDSCRPCFVEKLSERVVRQVAAGFYHTLCLTGPALSDRENSGRRGLVKSLSSDLYRLLDNPLRSDVTFIVEGKAVHGHRCIIGARCEPLERMLDGTMKEAVSEGGSISVPNHRHVVFLAFLEFIYTDKVMALGADIIDLEIVLDLLAIADQFLVDGLKVLCENAVLKKVTADNVCELLVEVHARLLITLRRKCFEYVLANHGVVSSSAAYARLPPSLLQEISTATGEESG